MTFLSFIAVEIIFQTAAKEILPYNGMMKPLFTLLFIISISAASAQPYATLSCTSAFSDSEQVSFTLPADGDVSLLVYNRFGNTVVSVCQDSVLTAGLYRWTIHTDSLSVGAYFLSFTYDTQRISKQILKIDATTAINEPSQEVSKHFYPNPARDVLNIPFEGRKSVSIYTNTGELISLIDIDDNTISIGNFSEGVYIVQVSLSDSESCISDRIIVMK